jgi:FMN phosphatase YigB (HAD superfamily)
MPANSNQVTPKLVLFDIGGVVIDLDFEDARTTLESEYLMEPETFLELTRSGFSGETLSVTEKATIGAIGTKEYLLAFQNACKRPVPVETVERLRASMLGPERPEMLTFLTELKDTIRIAAFTNTIDLHWRLLSNPKNYRSSAVRDDFCFSLNRRSETYAASVYEGAGRTGPQPGRGCFRR